MVSKGWRCETVKMWDAYREQKHGARGRGIEWKFTFLEWKKIWEESGHWHERGRKHGQYVMARYDDIGPYESDNVEIVLATQNCSEGGARAW
jgi:hypothetical protein